jgi:hypothetical protein
LHLPALPDYLQEFVLMVFPHSPDCCLPADCFDDFDPMVERIQNSAKPGDYYSVDYMQDFALPGDYYTQADCWLTG